MKYWLSIVSADDLMMQGQVQEGKNDETITNNMHTSHMYKRIEKMDIKWWFGASVESCKMMDIFINTLRPRQDGRHFPDDIFKCIFLNENV